MRIQFFYVSLRVGSGVMACCSCGRASVHHESLENESREGSTGMEVKDEIGSENERERERDTHKRKIQRR